MTEALLRNESPAEYFRELVESALQHQHVAVRELTSFYVVNLLTGFVHLDRSAAPGSRRGAGGQAGKGAPVGRDGAA